MKKLHKTHWLDAAFDALSSSTGDLRELARFFSASPKNFYTMQNLADCDLRGQDLRGMDFTGCNIELATIDDATRIDAEFDPRIGYFDSYVSFKIPRLLNKLILEYSKDSGYTYDAWAYKSLFERGCRVKSQGQWDFYKNIVTSNPYFSELIDYRSQSNLLNKTMQVYRSRIDLIEREFQKPIITDTFGWIMLIGAISKRIRHKSRKDYSNLIPNSLFPPKEKRFIR